MIGYMDETERKRQNYEGAAEAAWEWATGLVMFFVAVFAIGGVIALAVWVLNQLSAL